MQQSVGSGQKLHRFYEHLQSLQEDADNHIPIPYPLVEFYVGDEKLTYFTGPKLHYLSHHTADERAAFEKFCDDHPDIEVTDMDDRSISVNHHEWTAESGLEATEQILHELYDLSLNDIDYAEITSPHPEEHPSWEDV